MLVPYFYLMEILFSGNPFNGVVEQFCNSNNLCWSEPVDGSIHYTYHSCVNDHYSSIGHFVCSSQLIESIKSTSIHSNTSNGINTSDHLAISLTVEAHARCAFMAKPQSSCFKLQWEKVDTDRVPPGLLSQLKIPVEALSCSNCWLPRAL